MTVYFISGLGADERVFKRLSLPSTLDIQYIQWPELSAGETLSSYCKKIAQLIDGSERFAIVGLSFGGIVAVELSKLLQPEITIIISSIATKSESPFTNKFIGNIQLNKLIPSFLLNKVSPLTYWLFGVTTDADKKLLKQIINDTSPRFMKWAINEIACWTNDIRPKNLFHIHGTKDRLFPINKTHADLAIEGGGHLMVYINADLISPILAEKLKID